MLISKSYTVNSPIGKAVNGIKSEPRKSFQQKFLEILDKKSHVKIQIKFIFKFSFATLVKTLRKNENTTVFSVIYT